MCFPIPTQHEACGVFPWVMLRYQLSARTATFEPKPSSINTGSFVEHGTIRKCRSSPCLSVPGNKHGSLNVPIEHHPTIRYMVYNGYFFRWLSNIPKMGQLPTPVKTYIFWPYSILYQPSDFSVLSNWMTMILQGGLQCVWQDTFTILLHRLCVIVPR